ncbi:hypothetical protein BpHYR1_038884 [Brachionus plicatilis]|uniref:RNA-directed DNA polymerase from mobile element jockey-like n=1 Tax=Brachionus plicatilis TaxID=10195 RepID=A0A3M7RLJ1_BRAPC|nr:hypothetical protein BpHYR1_038884 [Brachionus plicatilis]
MCSEFGRLWKINFNPTKSVIIFQNWSKNDVSRDFYLSGIKVQKVNSLFYLGLPIGDHVFKENYWDEKFKKVQKALYSLNGVGCRAFGLEPKILARLYSIYCQPIFNYGIEICHIKKNVGKIIDLDPFTEDGKVCLDALDQFYVSKITQIDKAQLYRKIVHLCDLLCKDQSLLRSIRAIPCQFGMDLIRIELFFMKQKLILECSIEFFDYFQKYTLEFDILFNKNNSNMLI